MKLQAKPWNDPWTRRAEKDPQYKTYCYGHRAASRMSWRRLKKLSNKIHFRQPLGRVERRIARAQNGRY